jgi:hypothetical protein
VHQTITRLQTLETEIFYRDPPPAGQTEFTYLPGSLPVLLSAPHGAAHIRNGRLKVADEYTASFARLVAEKTGAHVLYAHHKSNTDPNYDRHAPYKICLKKIIEMTPIRFVMDIHGASPRRDFGIALGTMHGRTCRPHQRQQIMHILAEYGFVNNQQVDMLDRLDLDNIFPGGEKQHTVTHYVSQTLKIPAAQFELNAYLRTYQPMSNQRKMSFKGDPPRIYRAINAFIALVNILAVI